MSHKHKRVLVLNDGSKYENWGIKACVDGLYQVIRAENPEVIIEGIDHASMHRRFRFEPRLFGRPLITESSRLAQRLIQPYHVLPRVADEFDRVADLWRSGKGGRGAIAFMERAEKADVIVFNAEGSTYRAGNLGSITGLFMLWFAKVHMGKKSVFANGSVTLSRVDATLPAIVRKVFKAIDLVAVREPDSAQNVIEYYPELNQQVRMYPDSAFALDEVSMSNSGFTSLSCGKFFAFSLSMLPMDVRMSVPQSQVVQLIHKLKELVPNVVLLAKDREDQVLKEVAEATKARFLGPSFTYGEVMHVLERAEFLVSGRYHHLIFATKVGCPVIPFNTSSQKIHGLASLFNGTMPAPLDPTDLQSETIKIVQHARDILSQGEVLRATYRARAGELKRDVLHFSGDIRAICNEKMQ